MRAIPQQAVLFSCSETQSSYDTGKGGVYLGNLLRAAQTFDDGALFKLVGCAHVQAIPPTIELSRSQKDGLQEPDSLLKKCLSEQQLIIAINEIHLSVRKFC
jgi:hypothetical protein